MVFITMEQTLKIVRKLLDNFVIPKFEDVVEYELKHRKDINGDKVQIEFLMDGTEQDIEEEIVDRIENETAQWKCKEVTIYQPITKEQLNQAVITSIWDNDFEKKLINDYNGAKAGLFDTVTKAKYIANYTDFLNERKAIKEQIDFDWNNR